MSGLAKQYLDELLKLPAHDRSVAAEALLLSLEDGPDEDPAEVEVAWAAEIERRIEENSPGIPSETVFAEGRARLQKRA